MGIPPAMIWDKKYLKLEKGISVVFTPTKPFFDLGGRKSRGEKLLTSGEKLPIGGEKLPAQNRIFAEKARFFKGFRQIVASP